VVEMLVADAPWWVPSRHRLRIEITRWTWH